VRLILTLEYDGTPFRGWAAQPGLPTIEAALREALEATFESVEGLAVAGRHRHGRPRTRPRWSRSTSKAAHRRSGLPRHSNPRLPDEITVRSAAQEPGGLPRPSFRAARAATATGCSRGPRPSPFELRRSWWFRGRLDEEALAAAAASSPGNTTFALSTPTQTHHEVFHPCRRARGVDPSWRPPRLRDHGRQLPPPHGAQPRGHDGRGPCDGSRAPRRPLPPGGGRHRAAVWPVPRFSRVY
jgi:tRNA U38,U39,U40 pseudouridine synthase TruA